MKKFISCLLSFVLCLVLLSVSPIANANSVPAVRLEMEYEPNPNAEPYTGCYGIIKAYKNEKLSWEYKTEKALVGESSTISDVFTNNNTVYIVVNHVLYALDLETGAIKWTIGDMGTDNRIQFDRYGNIYVSSFWGPTDVTVISKSGEKLYIKDEAYNWVTELEMTDDVLIIHYFGPEEGYDYLNITQFKPITVELDGKNIEFDQPPVIVDGRTLVPVRAVVEAMNGAVEWNGATKTASLTLKETTIKLTVDSTTAYLNGEARALDVAPQIINDRTLLPIRFIAESFGYNVNWDANNRIVGIFSILENSTKLSLNYDLISCIGKTKKEIVNIYGDITNSSYWLGGKYYTHQYMASELYYVPAGEYDYAKHDDVNNLMRCDHLIANLSELLKTPEKETYTIDELRSLLGNYEFYNDLESDFYPRCTYTFYDKEYQLVVDSDHLNPAVNKIYVFKSNPTRDAFTKFIDAFQQTPLLMQSMPYNSILHDKENLTSMQQMLSYSYLDVDVDGQDELIISSKILSPEYDMGGSCFSLWDYSTDMGVYNIFAKVGMSARSAYTYCFVENNEQVFLLEAAGMSNSVGRNSCRNLYQIKDTKVVPVTKIVYDSFEDIYTVNGEHVSAHHALDKINEIDGYNCVIKQDYSNE